jgi:flavin-binding protein dodecin
MAKAFDVATKAGISNVGFTDAVKSLLEDEKKSKSIGWFEVVEQRGRIDQNGQIEYQVTVKFGYRS